MDTGSRFRRPHPALADCVESYVGYRHTSAPGVHHGLPSQSLTLVIAFDEPIDLAWSDRSASRSAFWSMVSGLHTRAALIHHSGFQHGVQVSLTPYGARALFGLPAAALARELVDLRAVLPRSVHHDQLAESEWEARFRALDDLFLGLLGGRRPVSPRAEVTHAWDLLRVSCGAARIADVASAVGWSRRHLGQRFSAEMGITPKEAARVFRFQHSRRLLTSGRRLVDVAMEAGYADQAHLTREWRELAGYTPTDYRREELPFLQDRTPEGLQESAS